MKHIIVTTPKSEMKNAAKEAQNCIENGGGYYFRKISKYPKFIEMGESYIYYIEDGCIRGRGLIVGISEGQEQCQTTGESYGSKTSFNIWVPAHTWQWIKPIPKIGFQGWRYFDDHEVEVVGGWKDRKPQTR